MADGAHDISAVDLGGAQLDCVEGGDTDFDIHESCHRVVMGDEARPQHVIERRSDPTQIDERRLIAVRLAKQPVVKALRTVVAIAVDEE